MKITPPILSAALTLLLVPIVQAQDYYREFANAPVPVLNKTGGANNQLYLVGEDRGELVFRYQPDSPQEMSIPLDTDDLLIVYAPPKEYSDHMAILDAGKFNEAVAKMRPYAYPLIKYIEVPPDNINIHPIVDRFTFALTRSDNLDEALALVRRLPLERLNPKFIDYAFVLTERLVEAGRSDEALTLLNRIPLSAEQKELLPKVMQFAARLRQEGNYEEALFLYQRIQDIPDTGIQEEAILWTAYTNMEIGKVQTAELFLEKAGELKSTERPYSLMKLIEGRLAMLDGDTIGAMSSVAQGIVSGDIGFPWMPELLYQSGSLYEQLEQPEVAREIYGEVNLFFSSTNWGEKSRERLAQLPENVQ